MPSAAAPLTKADLDRFRDRADRFIADLDEEFYLHYAGLKEKLELAPIYERYSELTQLEQAQALGRTANGDRGIRELWRFAAEGYLSELTREQAEKAAELEATLEADVDGETIPFRMLRPTMANEPDRDRRERIDRVRTELTEEHLNPLHAEGVHIVREGVEKLEAPNYADLYRKFGFRLDELADQCRGLLDSTEKVYEQAADKLFRSRVGVSSQASPVSAPSARTISRVVRRSTSLRSSVDPTAWLTETSVSVWRRRSSVSSCRRAFRMPTAAEVPRAWASATSSAWNSRRWRLQHRSTPMGA